MLMHTCKLICEKEMFGFVFFPVSDAIPGLLHTKGSMANALSKAPKVAMAQVVTVAIGTMLGELVQLHKQ